MVLFRSIKDTANLLKGDDPIEGAVLCRGVITAIEPTGTSVILGGIERYFCRVTVTVALDDTETYSATCTEKRAPCDIAQVRPGATPVAVDVDPADRNHVRIDWMAPAPPLGAACTVGALETAEAG